MGIGKEQMLFSSESFSSFAVHCLENILRTTFFALSPSSGIDSLFHNSQWYADSKFGASTGVKLMLV